uniref:Uncharacterized protein AlNc14C165G7861 n=1 Tax=Albugo laibachii Nc14 TaxID=890382 RepID=F0WN29_9STRA|nr:conserved hypothetical protein [Albugo laibachii Nc14]|eukprot:CCA22716.1 conserved hypothetical protein [Albugo laibachii Nc14]
MDLYADLPLAKGTSAGLPGTKETTNDKSKVNWKAPALVPQLMQARKSTLPSSGPDKNPPNDSATGKRTSTPPNFLAIAGFKPTSVLRKPVQTSKREEKLVQSRVVDPSPSQNVPDGQNVPAVGDIQRETLVNTFFQSNARDEYDPARPNSYEVYCEERTNKKKLDKVKRDLEKRQRVQEEEAKKERAKLVKDVEAGKVPSLGTGRGRGMTLPAWMQKKISESANAESDLPEERDQESVPTVSGQFDDPVVHSEAESLNKSCSKDVRDQEGQTSQTPIQELTLSTPKSSAVTNSAPNRRKGKTVPQRSRVILLQNMVTPDEVDDHLGSEVKEECSQKYGPVRNCIIYKVVSHPEAIRIFVEFENVQDADRAVAGLNGRFFGGRKVLATNYNESKFRRLDFSA